ncbi:MAG: F-type H+-transporting ATPase subunit b [Parcubacteria group bacterium Gr01-1014_30]|nr:MAG: F-type H+-transporting ATPase subunit b [Parcubacteria group bacterium Gr01-1014_30]
MSELLHQLGIDWKLLLSQAVNFLVLLAVLTFFLYRPLLRIMRERRQKIELGMRGAEEAEHIIAQAEDTKKQKIAAAEGQALSIISSAEKEALKQKEQLILEARSKSDALLEEAADVAERRLIEQLSSLLADAKQLIKDAIVKTVSLRPDQVDEKLIDQAVHQIKSQIPNSKHLFDV